MGLDIYFYKKDYVEIDEYGSSRKRELFDYMTTECGVKYSDEDYGKEIPLTKRQVNKLLRYMNKYNEYGQYNRLISEIGYLKENNQTVYMSADW